jgi:hypothetical protein
MQTLKLGSTGPDVRALQAAINARAAARGLPAIDVDGEYGAETEAAAKRLARALGALEATIAKPGTSIGEQRIIRWPTSRTPAQYARAAGRRRATPAGAQAALRWARLWIGKTEQPPGSNKAPWGLTAWQQALGSWLIGQAWCGTFVGTALKHAGVNGVTARVAGVILILDDALNHRNGMRSVLYRRSTRHGDVSFGRPGDLLGLFGERTHVGMIEKRIPGGYQTVEGNTSPGAGGSQSNGGGCFRRTRPDSAVVYIVRPAYPEA